MPGALVDTDVLIEALRGDAGALGRIDAAAAGGERVLSVLTAAELRAGRRGDDVAVDRLVESFRAQAVEVTHAEAGGRLRRRYGPTHGTGLVDAILAATALELGLVLVTNNRRHYPMAGLELA